MNSRGRKPTVFRPHIFDPAGVAHLFNLPPWVVTHGYSCWTASRSEFGGRCQDVPDDLLAVPRSQAESTKADPQVGTAAHYAATPRRSPMRA